MAYEYRLLTAEEALRALKMEAASDPLTEQINDALDAASVEIQNYLGRDVLKVSRIEYHTRPRFEPDVLWVKHWPIGTVTEVAEDADRVWGATSVLTAGTDYQINTLGDETTEIQRLSGGAPSTWSAGFEAVKVTFTGGWLVADIPKSIKSVCGEYMARLYHAAIDQEHAFESIADARGAVKTYGPLGLLGPQRKRIANYRGFSSSCVRWELVT